jgi:hypothetical protein
MTEISQHGILPPGIHEMSGDEIGRLFGNVPKSQCRLRLFETFQKYVERLQTLHIGIALIVDGSFVMPCVEKPADIDIILVMPKDWRHTVEKIPLEQYNLQSPVRVEAEFAGIHLFAVAENSAEYHEWIRWFSQIKDDWCFMFDIPDNMSKGLIRVTL